MDPMRGWLAQYVKAICGYMDEMGNDNAEYRWEIGYSMGYNT